MFKHDGRQKLVERATWQQAESVYRKGDLHAARNICERLLGTPDEHAGVHWMLSRAHQADHHFRLAVRHARLAASDVGKLPLAQQLAITRGLIYVGDYHAVLMALRAIDLPCLDDVLLAEIVDQFATLEAHADASRWLDRAQTACVANSDIAFLRGNNLKFAGDARGAADAFEDAISLAPASPHPYLALATLGLAEGSGARIDRIRGRIAALSSGAANSNDGAVLHYALFRELDGLEDIGGAWASLTRAMRSKRSDIVHSMDQEDAMFDRLIDAYGSYERPGGIDQAEGRIPVFIVGMPRTGTTLMERVLDQHPLLGACGELSDLRMAYKWASDYYCQGFLDLEAATRMAEVDATMLGASYMERTTWRNPSYRWFSDKHPGNYLFAGLILRALPQARIISVRRDPMDSCFANLRELFAAHYHEYSYSIEDVANHCRNHRRLMDHLAKVAPGRILEVRYEDFVLDPQHETARMLAYCGLPESEGLADMRRDAGLISTASALQVREPIHSRRIGYWKRYAQHLAPLAECLEAHDCLN